MKIGTILTFGSGVFVTLVITGIGWTVWTGGRGSVPVLAQEEKMEERPGMTMGGMKMGGADDQDGPAQAEVMISPARRQFIGVKTDIVKARALDTVIRTVGTVDYDERKVHQVNLRVSGWITDLSADYTGKFVKRGDPLLTLYSPDLVSTQEEYLLARRSLDRVKTSPVMHIRTGAETQVESARNRLLLWNVTEKQIAELEARQTPQRATTLYSPVDGVVTKKAALQGMYVTPEMNLYEIADLSTVWIHADIYEYEVARVRLGQDAKVNLASYPGETFHGRVVYIYPYLNPETRTVKVRMELSNTHGRLKPGMYGNVEIRTGGDRKLSIPQEAVLDSGVRKLVFVEKGEGMYEPREITVGNKGDRFYPILSGLSAGEKVVTSATFLIDSESKLMAATSMMGMLGMGGIKMEQGKMGEMEGMKGMEGIPGMENMQMVQGSAPREQKINGLTVTLGTTPEPLKKGENVLRLTIQSEKGPVTDAQVSLAYIMAMPGMEVETVKAKQTGRGVYEATVEFPMKGDWNVDATIVYVKSKPVTAHFTVQVGK
jgi:Cu(I)/Ag(I) efflux system membrane fusion protein